MRVGIAAVAALLLILAPAVTAHDWTAPKPQYAVGDFWLYRLNSTEAAIFALNGTLNVSVESFGSRVVNGTSVAVVQMLFQGSGVLGWSPELNATEPLDGTWEIQGSESWEASAYKLVHGYLRVEGSGTFSSQPFSFENVNVTDNVVWNDTWLFPLDDEGSGRIVSNTTYSMWTNASFPPPIGLQSNHTEGGFVHTVNLTTEGLWAPRVPAGIWETLRVNESQEEGYVHHYYAPAIGGDARTDTFNATGGVVSRLELLAYRYQAAETSPPTPAADYTLVIVATTAAAAGIVTAIALRRRRKARVEWRSYEEEIAEGDPPTGGP